MISKEDNFRQLHQCQIPVRWGDMDAYGHVNNALYMRYLEEARVQFLAQLGAAVDGNGTDPVIINVGCTFLRPISYPATVNIKISVGEIGRSSFMTWYELSTTDAPDVICSEGYSKVVWMDHNTGRSVPLPDAIRQRIS
ncbi:thioesterase family protein [Amphritea sp. 1_MG-2023]|uniref:acyl-CoA thioesterase n=1 Tax=Amphritea sp. 1_MG-2023 TaxID=3062670 RepID=UPI0026E17C4C|nr:thioesterase family protein [Amphritea sp. 1_MG-2023]MDO6563015.1 thioesterase family protein [Amphritea sp. 1_MG-2023]